MLAPEDDPLSAEQAAELDKIVRKSRNGEALHISQEEFFKGYEQYSIYKIAKC